MNDTKHVKLRTSTVLAVLIMLAPIHAQAQFVAIDTFQKESLGELGRQNGWTTSTANAALVKVVVDSANPGNQVLQFSANATTVPAYKSISIPNTNSAATLFFRARRAGESNMNWGVSDVAAPAEFVDYEAQINMQTAEAQNLRVRNLDAFVEGNAPFAANTWYKTWMVINNSANTYEIFVQGGALRTPTPVAAGGRTVFDFRNGAAANELASVFLRSNTPHTDDFSIDDIYLDTGGRNLNDPTASAP